LHTVGVRLLIFNRIAAHDQPLNIAPAFTDVLAKIS